MSKISDQLSKARAARARKSKSAPKAAPENNTPQPKPNESSNFPVGLLASIVLFIFFGAKYGIKRE